MNELTAKCPSQITDALEDMLLDVVSLETMVLAIASQAGNLVDGLAITRPESSH